MTTSEVATVLAWNDALNEANIATLLSLSSDDIDIIDDQGAIQGHQALQIWATRQTTRWKIGRMYVHHGVVVAELCTTDTLTGAAVFRVVHDQVTAMFHHDDLAEALRVTEMTLDDQVV